MLRLKYACKIVSSNVDKHYKDDEIEVRLCNYTDVYYNKSIESNMDLMVATATAPEIEKFSLRKNDVIITKDSESFDDIAVPAIVGDNCQHIVCGYHLAIIRPNENILLGRYLYWFLSSSIGNFQFQINSNGVTRYGLPKYWVDNSLILLPPLTEQIIICKFLEAENFRINQIINLLGGDQVKDLSHPNSMIGKLIKYRGLLLDSVLSGDIQISD